MIREKLKKLKLNTTATAEKYMGYSRAITAYCQTCNSSHRAKDNEHRRISRIPDKTSFYDSGLHANRCFLF